MRVVLIWACQAVLIATGVAVVQSVELTPAWPTTASARMAPDSYTPHGGVRFNDPYSRDGHRKNAVKSHILRTVNSMRRGSTIRIASWNVRGGDFRDALIAAHNRGVIVKIVMGAQNGPPTTPNPDVHALRTHLQEGNKSLPWAKRSWLHYCDYSCRGYGGIAHTKFYLFDRVSDVTDVIMYGSANLTQIAADDQWNDLYTVVGRAALFDTFVSVFDQMNKDTGESPAYVEAPLKQTGKIGFYPYTGKTARETPDPILALLNRTHCAGATGGTGVKGHTKIRIAQDALWGERGNAIADRLATMARRGCNIKIVYTLFGNTVLHTLRSAKVPLTHLAYDTDRDGEYDHYLHMKTMAISGVIGSKTNASVVTNGSANWTELPLHSDEVTGTIWEAPLAEQYADWIDWMFANRPADWIPPDLEPVSNTDAESDARRVEGPDPYALVRRDL
jgi:phosphatidylserine/phosphatidylglycerophosphate/cardiolipin synthase-like enzyme